MDASEEARLDLSDVRGNAQRPEYIEVLSTADGCRCRLRSTSMQPFICLSFVPALCVCRSLCLSVCLFVCLSQYPCLDVKKTGLSCKRGGTVVGISTSSKHSMQSCLCLSLVVSLSMRASICLSVRLSIYVAAYLSKCEEDWLHRRIERKKSAGV